MVRAVELGFASRRFGVEETLDLARAIEEDGLDEVDFFDHVTMGHPTATRLPAKYPARMAILELLVTRAAIAARTRRIRLGVEVLVLPQRRPALATKQAATLDVPPAGGCGTASASAGRRPSTRRSASRSVGAGGGWTRRSRCFGGTGASRRSPSTAATTWRERWR